MTKVENMVSSKGNVVANQFIIIDNDKTTFQSYKSIICIKYNDGKLVFDPEFWKYSKTTIKYRNMFLGMNTKELIKKIKESIMNDRRIIDFQLLNGQKHEDWKNWGILACDDVGGVRIKKSANCEGERPI